MRVRGKLFRKSLETDVLSIAKLRLSDFEKAERQAPAASTAASSGRMTFGEALNIYRQQTEPNALLKPSTKKYRRELIKALMSSWPGLEPKDVGKITESDCRAWALQLSSKYSATRFNSTIGLLRQVFSLAVEAGALYRNPVTGIKRARVLPKTLHLPSRGQFERFVAELENGGGRDSVNCADLVRFLSFGGFRKGEAAAITWADCDFQKGEVIVRGDPETGTKNWGIRQVPMIPDMRQFLERIRAERAGEPASGPVMRVRECQKAMDRSAKLVGMRRITHHDLRHLFATRCIEAGVDIPTVARWLGHKDGGALAMKTYGHLRNEHSQEMAKKVRF